MIPIEGRPILTAAEMRAAEDEAIAAGVSVGELMERAGGGVAEAARRLSAGDPILVLCGPGNNGGDGYVAARVLHEGGAKVRVAALAAPRTEAARHARQLWEGPVEDFAAAAAAPVLVDCLFGTGLSRGLDGPVADRLTRLAKRARLSIAVDLPSGVVTDTGERLSEAPGFDVTLALGAVKPAHLLYPAAASCGTVRLIDIGINATSRARIASRPSLPAPGPASHKYSRGMVAIVAGAMPGAAALASEAALRAGAGYALLLGEGAAAPMPHAVVRRDWSADALDDSRIGAVIVGPGLGRDRQARERLEAAIAGARPLVIDGDALHLLDDSHFARFARRDAPVILTPHGGEFAELFGDRQGGKLDAARAGAERSHAVTVFKGPDTIVAAPDGAATVHPSGSFWLSTAGTGDVLTGAIGAALAAGGEPLDSAAAGVWMHGEAARRLGGAFIADDLARELSAVRASL